MGRGSYGVRVLWSEVAAEGDNAARDAMHLGLVPAPADGPVSAPVPSQRGFGSRRPTPHAGESGGGRSPRCGWGEGVLGGGSSKDLTLIHFLGSRLKKGVDPSPPSWGRTSRPH